MLNKILICGLIFIIACFSNCTKLKEEPKGLLAPESFFKTVPDVEAGLFGAYSQITSFNLYGRDYSVVLMLRSDMVEIGDLGTTAERKQIDAFAVNAENGLLATVWASFYRSISAANTVIQASSTVTGDAAKKSQLEAEAKFIRGFSYFNLVRMFGGVPYVNLPVESTSQLKGVQRTPVDEVYNAIIEDLTFAKKTLPHRHGNDVRNRATSGTAATVLADVYLTLKQFDKAAAEAKYVIANAQSLYNYRLEPNYQDLFNGPLASSIKEPIFTTDWTNTIFSGGVDEDWLIPLTRFRGLATFSLSVLVPSLKVYSTWDQEDYRRKVSFEDSVIVGGVKRAVAQVPVIDIKRPHIAKYFRFPGPQASGDTRQGDNDYHIYRYADILLMAAEAIAESAGVTPEAIGYVNQVRARARFNGTSSGTSPANIPANITTPEFIRVLREERRLEFAFEFNRWFDIKRWGILGQVFSGPNALETRTVDLSRDYLFPIPLNEIRLNGWKQNEGY